MQNYAFMRLSKRERERERASRLEVDCTVALRIKVTSRWNRFPAGLYSGEEWIRLSHIYESARMSVINGNGNGGKLRGS